MTYATAGHHPALLVEQDGARHRLGVPGLMIGVVPGTAYPAESVAVPEGSRLYLFSDGLFEVRGGDDDQLLGLDGVADMLAQNEPGQRTRVERAIDRVRGYRHGEQDFDDDVSLLEVEFVR